MPEVLRQREYIHKGIRKVKVWHRFEFASVQERRRGKVAINFISRANYETIRENRRSIEKPEATTSCDHTIVSKTIAT